MHHARLGVWVLGLLVAAAVSADAATLRVCASGCAYSSVQPAIDAAQPGDTILLRAGETFVGHLVLRKKSGTADIVIRSDAPDTDLPAAGVRLVPSTRGGTVALSKLARLKGKGGSWKSTPLVDTELGAHNYRLQFLDIDGIAQEAYGTLVSLGNNTTQTSASLAPYAITFDRVYVHGDPVRGQKRCMALNSASTSVLNSFFGDCKHFASDSQAIAGFNGPGPFLIENNYLEGSTENIMFGGADPKTPNLVPSDIVIRRNYITKPLSWRNPVLATPGSPKVATSSASGILSAGTHYFRVQAVLASGGAWAFSAPSSEVSLAISSSVKAVTVSWSAVPGASSYRVFRGTTAGGENRWLETTTASTTLVYTGSNETSATPKAATAWTVKNLVELKNAQRVTIEGNVIENAWKAAQTGFAILLTPKNQENTAPWTAVRDVTVRYNTVRHANGGVNILGRDYSSSTGSQLATRLSIVHNVFSDIGGTWGGGAQWILMSLGPSYVTVDHNTVFHTGHVVFVDNGTCSNFVFRNNMARHNEYGIAGSGASFGNTAIAAYFPGGVVTKNVLAGGDPARYPSGNFFPSVSTWLAQFVNQAAGDYRLLSGSPYKNAGTDGLDLGANLTALAAAQAGNGTTDPAPSNQPPTASTGGPYTSAPGASLTVSGSRVEDPDGSVASYRWAWGDGTAAGSGVTATHAYASAGTYTLTLTVTDNGGATGSASTTVTVGSTPTTGGAGDIVLTAADVTVIKGAWTRAASTGSPGGQAMASTEKGWWQTTAPLAEPANYFEAPFVPAAGTGLPRVAAARRALQVGRLGLGAVHRRERRLGRAALAHRDDLGPARQPGGVFGVRGLGMGLAGRRLLALGRLGRAIRVDRAADDPRTDARGRRAGGPDRPEPGALHVAGAGGAHQRRHRAGPHGRDDRGAGRGAPGRGRRAPRWQLEDRVRPVRGRLQAPRKRGPGLVEHERRARLAAALRGPDLHRRCRGEVPHLAPHVGGRQQQGERLGVGAGPREPWRAASRPCVSARRARSS